MRKGNRVAILLLLLVAASGTAYATCGGPGSLDCYIYGTGSGECASDAPGFCHTIQIDQEGHLECQGSAVCADAQSPTECGQIPDCTWSGGYAPTSYCASYGETCIGGYCCAGLVCDQRINTCTQPTGVCSYLQEKYNESFTQTVLQGKGGPNETLENLEKGIGIGPEDSSKGLASGSNLYQVGWFSDWKTAGLVGVAIAIAIIAVAAMIGHGFNLPEVKAFVDTELSQAVVSVLLIFALVGLIAFFDQTARLALAGADLPVACNANEPCYITAAKFYIDNLYDTAGSYARNELTESVKNQAAANAGISTQFNLWYLAFAGTSLRPNAGQSLRAERAGAIFETVSKLMASLNAQRYFLDAVAYGIAPVFMLLGILLRTFFFTRRLGGLLLAIAAALFIIYPLTYAFAWYTLNVTIYGERTSGAADPACPSECTARYPVAFYISPEGKIVGFETVQQIVRAGINALNWEQGGPKDSKGTAMYPGLVACRDLSTNGLSVPNECNGCPDYCREIPFPAGLPGCDIVECSSCNPGCKLLRQRTDCKDLCDKKCGMNCRTKTPVENGCFDKNEGDGIPEYRPADLSVSCAACNGCPTWCRVLQKLPGPDGGTELLYKNEPGCQKAECNNCPAGCMYETQIGASSKCDDACSAVINGRNVVCPYFCRVNGTMWSPPDLDRYDTTQDSIIGLCNEPEIAEACSRCPGGCLVDVPVPQPATCAPYPDKLHVSQSCNDCPEYCRWNDYDFITDATTGKLAKYSMTNLVTDAGQEGGPLVPYVCQQDFNGRLNCGGTACGSSCSAQGEPRFCRIFNESDTGHPDFCRLCPPEVRVNLTYTDATGLMTNSTALLKSGLTCEDNYCPPDDCKRVSPSDSSKVFQLPGQPAGCFDYDSSYNYIDVRNPDGTPKLPKNCELCQPFCRVVTKVGDEADGLDKDLKADACRAQVTRSRSTWCTMGSGTVCENKLDFEKRACCSDGLQCGPAPTPQTASTTDRVEGGKGSLSVALELPYTGDDLQYAWSFTAGDAEIAPGESITWTASGKSGSGLSGAGLPAQEGTVGSVTFSNAGTEITVYKQVCGPSGCATPACSLSTPRCNPDDTICAYNPVTDACKNLTAAPCSRNPVKCSPDDTVCTYNPATKTCRNTVDYIYTDYFSNITGMSVDYYGYQPGTKKCQSCKDYSIPMGGYCGDPETSGCCGKDDTYGQLTCDNYTRTCEPVDVTIDPCGSRPDTKWGGAVYCPSSCQYPAPSGITCHEYLGNGPRCEGKNVFDYVECKVHLDSASCVADTRCSLRDTQDVCAGPADKCANLPKETCELSSEFGCRWQTSDSITVPILLRDEPYNIDQACSQCPEHCRLMDGSRPLPTDCGVIGRQGEFIDCSTLSCPEVCRVAEPSGGSCGAADPLTLQCEGCPALCRRDQESAPDAATLPTDKPANICPTGTYCSESFTAYRNGCYSSCRLDNPPAETCEACYDCPLDCTFYPAVRTDCSEVCSDEALSAPLSIGPTDYIKKLPGAQGESDVKGVGALMVPALVLPLFCLVMVIAFVRILSHTLGGDIDIPGLGRII